MLLSRIAPLFGSSRRWWFLAIALLVVAAVLLALARPQAEPAAETVPPQPIGQSPQSPTNSSTSPAAHAPTPTPAVEVPGAAVGEPQTTDFRTFASAAAIAIYTWDTRSASYSEVYSRLHDWWHVLPDGSNPLAVLVQEFEATGVNAGSYGTLTGQQAYRTATVESLRCDGELAKVREQPAPWAGLHVCTVSARVADQSVAGLNAYTAPVSVMMNCPPAATAPPDHCIMVGFYATPSRIVY
jgi:hypothetical protein